jgi:hypothetical protein
MPPVIFAGGQAYTIQGQYAIPHPDVNISQLFFVLFFKCVLILFLLFLLSS